VVERYDAGQSTVKNWTADPPGDKVVRPSDPFYTHISADNDRADQGNLYVYDGSGRRVVCITKSNGRYVGEFILPASSPFFSAVGGMFIRTGPNSSNPTLFWIEGGNLLTAPLYTPTASPSASASGSAKASVKPTVLPSPTK
jgi:hypothetical protein